jgi:hypothetical protein
MVVLDKFHVALTSAITSKGATDLSAAESTFVQSDSTPTTVQNLTASPPPEFIQPAPTGADSHKVLSAAAQDDELPTARLAVAPGAMLISRLEGGLQLYPSPATRSVCS